VRELFADELWFVGRDGDPALRRKAVALERIDAPDMLLLEEGHCLREHAIAACGPRHGSWESRVEATSLTTLIQMVEGGLGVTLLPGITLDAGILKGTKLVARRLSRDAPSRTLALLCRRSSPRRPDADLLAEFLIAQRRGSGHRGASAPRRPPGPTDDFLLTTGRAKVSRAVRQEGRWFR
jgi:LysR family hydrogen peroxide-inducible transcriptional activator